MGEDIKTDGKIYFINMETGEEQRFDGIADLTAVEIKFTEQEVEQLKTMQMNGELNFCCKLPKKSYRKLQRFLIKEEIKHAFKNIKLLLKQKK